jgi:hypothetical protein
LEKVKELSIVRPSVVMVFASATLAPATETLVRPVVDNCFMRCLVETAKASDFDGLMVKPF